VSDILNLEMRRWIPLEAASKIQRNHHGRLVTSKVLRVYMTDHSWRQRLMILSKNLLGDGAGSGWAQPARACRILMLAAPEQVGRKSLCRNNLWQQNNWQRQRVIKKTCGPEEGT
jgi:hypothetical protein